MEWGSGDLDGWLELRLERRKVVEYGSCCKRVKNDMDLALDLVACACIEIKNAKSSRPMTRERETLPPRLNRTGKLSSSCSG